MSLSSDLISQFVKITNDNKKPETETTVYGTVTGYDTANKYAYVKLDGPDDLEPTRAIISTTAVNAGDRVAVMIKNHTAVVTGNMTSPSARVDDLNSMGDTLSEFEILVADLVSTDQLNAQIGRIDILYTDNTTIKETLEANSADIESLKAFDVTVNGTLEATTADIDNLKTSKLDASVAEATYATIESLDATNLEVNNLSATHAKINDLIFGSATGTTIQTSFSNAVIAQLGDAQIKSAMIESISADKIAAGDIITNNVRVKSEDGSLIISDETMQISDGTRVRVQIGKDASSDYSINIWDADGNLMFSQGGITDSAIKSAIIRNDMVSDTANIHASKLDIDSLFEEINDSTNTIKSTKIYLDDEAQTLDVAFKELSTTVTDQGTTITSQGTAISTIQGQISSKIWQQDIDTATDELSTKYSTLEQDLDGFQTTVSEEYATVAEMDIAVDETTSLINQLSDSISMLVTDGNGTSLMRQTDDGWEFSTAEIQTAINTVSENLDSLNNEMGSVSSTVNVLEQAVEDLGAIAEYVKIGTYEDEPCIELGEADSDFKLLITNTRIMFMEGSSMPAYINNQSLYIKKAVIEEELQQGSFVWKARSNGNLGLIWTGAQPVQPILTGSYYFNETMVAPASVISETLNNVNVTFSDGSTDTLIMYIDTTGYCTIEDVSNVYEDYVNVWDDTWGSGTPLIFHEPVTVSQELYDWFMANTTRSTD